MKKDTKSNFTKLTRNGISLIVLIITVIVVIILAAAVILTLSKNNPIESAREARFKEDVRSFQNDLLLTISKQYTDNRGNRDYKITTQSIPTTFDEIKKYIPNYTEKYEKKLGIKNDELVYFPDEVTESEKKWLEDLGIKPWIIEEASVDIFIWDENDSTKIIGYNLEPLKEYLSRNNNILKIPEKCKTIGSVAFLECDFLVNVIIPESVTKIESAAFRLCSNLTDITIPNSVTSIENNTFILCSSLTNVSLPNSITKIGSGAFSSCASLTEITLPESITEIGASVFYGCINLKNITIPSNITKLYQQCFYSCESLTNIIIPDSVESIGSGAFSDTPWYRNKEDGLVYINNILYAYKGEMPENTNIVIKDGTKKIVGDAFYKCTNLISITMPNSVTNIGEYAFYNCNNLNNITFTGTKNEWNNITKADGWKNNSNVTTITCSYGIITLE